MKSEGKCFNRNRGKYWESRGSWIAFNKLKIIQYRSWKFTFTDFVRFQINIERIVSKLSVFPNSLHRQLKFIFPTRNQIFSHKNLHPKHFHRSFNQPRLDISISPKIPVTFSCCKFCTRTLDNLFIRLFSSHDACRELRNSLRATVDREVNSQFVESQPSDSAWQCQFTPRPSHLLPVKSQGQLFLTHSLLVWQMLWRHKTKRSGGVQL